MKREWNPLVKEVLDGERRVEALPPDLRLEAEAARQALLNAIDRQQVHLSDSIDARVMARVRRHAAGPWSRAWHWLSAPTVPRWGVMVPIAAAAGLLLLGRSSTPPAAVDKRSALTGQRESVYVRFELYAPSARRVALAGTFNRWDPTATPLARVGSDGMWTVTLALPSGQHQYGFIVDGRNWVPDPGAPTVDDGFGRRNSVVSVNTINGRIL